MTPKAVRVMLLPATIQNGQELEAWLDDARAAIEEKLKDGSVIV